MAIILTFHEVDLWDTPVIRFLSMLSSFINSSIRVSMMYRPAFFPLPASTIINERFSPRGSNPIFPSIFAPSIPPNEKQATNVLNPALTIPRLPKMDIGVAAAYRYPRVSAELTWSEHCSVPSSGRIAAMSCIPPVRVEPIPPWLDDMASRRKIYCCWEVLKKNGLMLDHEKSGLEDSSRRVERVPNTPRSISSIYYCKMNVLFVTIDIP